ncbi:response regulator transcription factor [Pseudoalteromonas phenolica]|uniref:Two component transcriptional regulator, winged helix family protein n=1 Tax=Pseudoalteromonas phenolica TaxID=161398 RepID=A0A0S2JY62_9GAMM|nr:response regulator transcription factor [Pseudoalteromonas phenolica]ALO41088.1 Two component transcriptional regulator, winged helix family protein [Pseudoalteromonas phenolica]MBE0354386.1 two-component system, OmpR family, response regulator CpxR [Pseudoalteromonas phenolica O-BC30]RXE94008.1 DNA-binding response regulator [Pseudoalteromonas phenolica O-BC30]TMO55076.1 DNA-binding response regulator [Pseudoalteromonas phenolica]
MSQLLLIEDDIELSNLLCEYLQSQNHTVSQAFDGEAGLAMAKTNSFDVILLDIMMPKLDGFEVLKQLRQTHLTPVIMLTAKGDDFDRIFGLELGADDYISKPFNHRELLARINAITRRVEFVKQAEIAEIIEYNRVSLNIAARTVHVNKVLLTLTGTEFAVLQLLMTQVGKVVTKECISQEVLGRRLAPFDRSIDMHVSNLRKKIAQHSDVNCIQTMRGSGYVFLAQ